MRRSSTEHRFPVGAPCANCATPIEGTYCHNCGQLAESYERSVWGLVVEGFESFFHFDGRFWRTLPDLVWRPGKLTRDYLDGKRASQIPPLRLFLVVLLIVFFAGGAHFGGEGELLEAHRPNAATTAAASIDPRTQDAGESPFMKWMGAHTRAARENPRVYGMVIENWAHRFAILMLPIAALFLSILFVFQRRFYVFDHLIFAMHSLSFQGLLLSIVFLLGNLTPLAGALLILSPAHLFAHMRGTYRTSVIGTLVRVTLLILGSLLAASLLLAGVFWFGLSLMKAG